MIEKFDSYERAAMFVEEKRAEGYEAVILNEGTGFLWGPRTVGGFRVQVADEPGAPVEDPLTSESLPDEDFLSRAIRIGVIIFLAVGAATAVITAILSLESTLRLVAGALAMAAIVVGGGYLISRLSR